MYHLRGQVFLTCSHFYGKRNMKKILMLGAVACLAGASQAIIIGYAVPIINGAQEVPSVSTPAYGSASFTLDTATNIISGSISITNLPAANITMMHIHSGAVGVNGPVIFDLLGNKTGDFSFGNQYVMGFSGVLTGNVTQRINFLNTGNAYINVHTKAVGSGEIRGQVVCNVVPEPGTMAALGLGIAAFVRRRRSK